MEHDWTGGECDNVELPAELWNHQREALAVVTDYLASGQTGAASLITMPTGTGKTGVVGCASLLNSVGHTLVLAPRVAIAEQLRTDLQSRFWDRLGSPRPGTPVRQLPPVSRLYELAQAETDEVIVGTVQALETAMRTGSEDWTRPFERVGLVIIDEGHYEPAPEWSRAIRQLQTPTVLLTATPFRNDLKTFRIADEHVYRFKHREAEADRFLRRPEFERIGVNGPAHFIDQLIQRTETLASDYPDARVVVRCEREATVRILAELLAERGQNVVGIHERFSSNDPEYLQRAVPNVERHARYWVHQYKLIEGIDDPRFRVVAFYDVLRNDRAVIQQIGRAIRNPGREAEHTALVVSRALDRDPERVWRAYERFDAQDDAVAVATVPNLVRVITKSLPEAFYFSGGFKTPFEPDGPDAWRDFAYPLRTQIYRWRGPNVPTLQDLEEGVRTEWAEIDRRVYPSQRPPDALLVPYISADNSPLLRDATFVETKFGYTLLRLLGDVLFYFDARGRVAQRIKSEWEHLAPERLHRLLPKGDRTTLTSVSLLNTDVSRRAARARSVRATDLDALAPDLADHMYVCSITEGYTGQGDDRHRRYLGLSNARVTDYRGGDADFDRWHAWTTEIGEALGRRRTPTRVLERFAKLVSAPRTPDPVHVLIDVDTAMFVGPDGEQLDLQDSAFEVDEHGMASLTANGRPHDVEVLWNSLDRRYTVEAPSLVAESFREREGDGRELTRAINEDQALRIVPRGAAAIYSHGRFFATPVPTGTTTLDYPWIRLLEPLDELTATESEKGREGDQDQGENAWPSDSVFGLVDRFASRDAVPKPFQRLFPTVDLLLCTDMGSEVADFVIANPDRIAFVHAKRSRRAVHSASSLQEVIGQAMKNLAHLQPVDPPVPDRRNWCAPWRPTKKYEPVTRQRVGQYGDEGQLWTAMRDVITDPNSEREIWLLLGEALSKAAVEKNLASDKASPQTVQIYALLQNAWSACQQIGVRLRVFCSP